MKCNIKKGDTVKIDPDQCYCNYSQFIKLHLKYAIRWSYKCKPKETHQYKVIGVHKHCMKDLFDNSDLCIVVEDIDTKQIFLMGNTGIQLVK